MTKADININEEELEGSKAVCGKHILPDQSYLKGRESLRLLLLSSISFDWGPQQSPLWFLPHMYK